MAKPKPAVDLAEHGARVVSVYGAFNSRALVEMPAELAVELFPDGIVAAALGLVVDAVERDVAAIRERSPELAESALAASAVAMAREIENPYNSATSKSMCQARLVDAMRELRLLAPAEEAKDGVDDIREQRAKRLARRPAAAAESRP